MFSRLVLHFKVNTGNFDIFHRSMIGITIFYWWKSCWSMFPSWCIGPEVYGWLLHPWQRASGHAGHTSVDTGDAVFTRCC